MRKELHGRRAGNRGYGIANIHALSVREDDILCLLESEREARRLR